MMLPFVKKIKFRKNRKRQCKICDAFVKIHASNSESAIKEFAKFLRDVDEELNVAVEVGSDCNSTSTFQRYSKRVLMTTEPVHATYTNPANKSDMEPLEPINAAFSNPVNASDEQPIAQFIKTIVHPVRSCNSANNSAQRPSVEAFEPVIHVIDDDSQPSVIQVANYTVPNEIPLTFEPATQHIVVTTPIRAEVKPDINTNQLNNESGSPIRQQAQIDSNVAPDSIALNAEDHLINALRTSEAATTFKINTILFLLHRETIEKHRKICNYKGLDHPSNEIHNKYYVATNSRTMRFFSELFKDSANKIRTNYLNLSPEYQKAVCSNIINDIRNMCANEQIVFEGIESSWLHGTFADVLRPQAIDSESAQINAEYDAYRALDRERKQLNEREGALLHALREYRLDCVRLNLDKQAFRNQQEHFYRQERRLQHKEQELLQLKLQLSQQSQLLVQQHQQEQWHHLQNQQIPTVNQPNPLLNHVNMVNSPTSNVTVQSTFDSNHQQGEIVRPVPVKSYSTVPLYRQLNSLSQLSQPNQPLPYFTSNDQPLRATISDFLPHPPYARIPADARPSLENATAKQPMDPTQTLSPGPSSVPVQYKLHMYNSLNAGKEMPALTSIYRKRNIPNDDVRPVALPPQQPQPGPSSARTLFPADLLPLLVITDSSNQAKRCSTSHAGVQPPIRPTSKVYKDNLQLPERKS